MDFVFRRSFPQKFSTEVFRNSFPQQFSAEVVLTYNFWISWRKSTARTLKNFGHSA
jgi:hypothetical protein